MSITGTVGEYMSPNPACLSASDSLTEARDLFLKNGFTVAPVVDDSGVALGVVSATDLVASSAAASKVGEVVSARLYTTGVGDSIVEAATMMTDCGVHHLVILDSGRHRSLCGPLLFGWAHQQNCDATISRRIRFLRV